MKAIAICLKGLEDVSILEIKELIGKKAKKETDSVVSFEGSEDDLCLLCYKGQSFSRILALLGHFEAKNLDEIKAKALKVKYSDWVKKGKTFAVECLREGIHDFGSQDAAALIGEAVIESSKGFKPKVDLKNPDVPVFAYLLDEKCHIGIDFAGFDLSKRDYKIFSHPTSIKGPLAYGLFRLSNWSPKEVLLDTFCGSGTIPIEAAISAVGFPLGFYRKDKYAFNKWHKFDFDKVDKKISKKLKVKLLGFDGHLPAVNASAKNAKIAGIEKFVSFSKLDVEWLDTKFDAGKVDKIVTDPPIATDMNLKAVEKVYKEFFYQAEFVLSKKGKIVLLTRNGDLMKKYASEYKFRVDGERTVAIGQQEARILTFVRP